LKSILLPLFLFSACICTGQSAFDLAQERQYDPEVIQLMNQAKAKMAADDYESANKIFRKALATKKVLPTDLSYYFAQTLFVIHQYQNSQNFIDKYIELAGQGGNHYDEAVQLKKLLSKEFKEIRACKYCNLSGYRYITCDNCNGTGISTEVCYNCKGNGVVTCPKCMGNGVIVTFNSFLGKQYTACDLCDTKGYIICPVCHGEKTLTGTCSVCLGTGKKVSNIICNHQPEQEGVNE